MILVARLPMRGPAANPEIERWLAPIVHAVELSVREIATTEPETLCDLES
jgi:hypothetical protein